MSETQEKYITNASSEIEYREYVDEINRQTIEKPFNPSQFGAMDGSFNGTIYRTFDGKLTYKESNGVWVILASNGAKIPLVVFRGQIESDDFAEKLFKSFEVKEWYI
mgnify:FL=1